VALLAAGGVGGALWARSQAQAYVAGVGRIVSPRGVSEAGYVTLGGVRQWVRVRGMDRRQPILLYLHGGPGGATSDLAYAFQRPWEDYFTVVQWDQRGFGRSAVDVERMDPVTKARLVADTIELIEDLRRRYDQPKVILVGHSWGSILGASVARARPDLLYAYVGLGQSTAWEGGFEASRQAMVAEARRQGRAGLVQTLEAAGPPPSARDPEAFLKWSARVQPPVVADGWSWHNVRGMGDFAQRMLVSALMSDTLTLGDIGAMLSGRNRDKTLLPLVRSVAGWDFRRDLGLTFDVPMIFVSGRYDRQTPVAEVVRLEGELRAPRKRMVVLENSAHVLVLEEPGRLLQVLVEEALPLAQAGAGAADASAQPPIPADRWTKTRGR
jgi:pimeloyl-ACP methyl ester carboxylesterase